MGRAPKFDDREILVESRVLEDGAEGERLVSIRDISEHTSLQRVKGRQMRRARSAALTGWVLA